MRLLQALVGYIMFYIYIYYIIYIYSWLGFVWVWPCLAHIRDCGGPRLPKVAGFE